MSTLTETMASVTITGKEMKEIKNMIKSVKKSKTIDILNYLVFEAKENQLIVSLNYAGVHDFSIKQVIAANVENEGSFLVHADFIKKIKGIKNGNTYSFTGNNKQIEIIKNGSKQTFITSDIEEYPREPRQEFNHISTINYNEVLKLQDALLSISKSETRPILQTVLIRNGYIASTDSHRLYKTNTTIKHDQDIIMTPAGIKKLKDVFDKKDIIDVFVSEHFIKFKNETKEVSIRLFDGNYPEIERLIPEYPKTEMIINDVDYFKQIIEDARDIAINSEFNVVKFKITDNELHITANSPESGSYENTIEINKQGEDLKISMNAAYLLDAIKQVESDQLKLSFTGAMRPFTVTPMNNDNVLSLVLPVRTY